MRAPLLTLVSIAFFAGLVLLEVSRGLARLEGQRERHRGELVSVLERQQEALAREVEDLLGEGERHAAHLARSPDVRALLRGRGEAEAERLQSTLLPYLVSFRGLDRIAVLDAGGRELARCERMGGGVAAIPSALLDATPAPALAELAARAGPGQVVASPLVEDAQRVEVEERDRRVFHYLAPVDGAEGIVGRVVVTVYAEPLLHALARFEPIPGVTSCLLDEGGARVAGAAPAAGEPLAALLAGQARRDVDGAVLLAAPVRRGPAAWIVTSVPNAALEAAVSPPRGELLRVVLPTVAVALALVLGSAFFVRAGLRARRLAETEHYLARIAEESRRHRVLMEAAADLILVVDPDREHLADWNGRAGEQLDLGPPPGGDAREAAVPLERLRPALGEEGLAALRAALDVARTLEEGAARPAGTIPMRAVAGGDARELEARCAALSTGGERRVEVLLHDRTRERDMERQVRTAERLSSLGLLTAGVAHEINNPLEGIANYLSLLERPELPADQRTRYVARLRLGFQRIRDIVGDLLRFARPGQESGTADLGRVARRALSFARYSQELRDVEIELVGLDRPLEVPGSEGRLEQVVLNLLLNAGRAVRGAHRGAAGGAAGTVRVVARRDDAAWVELAVEDDGPGFAEEDLERVFDPFFTRGGGTGLGLSVSYGIARAHGGVLRAGNRAEGGARVVLRLPRALPEGAALAQEPRP